LWIDEQNRNRFFNIERDLEKYKYRKDVPPLEEKDCSPSQLKEGKEGG